MLFRSGGSLSRISTTLVLFPVPVEVPNDETKGRKSLHTKMGASTVQVGLFASRKKITRDQNRKGSSLLSSKFGHDTGRCL